MQVSWLWAWCAIVRRATGGFQQFLGSMRHVSSRWCRFSSGLRAGANFGRSPAHAYAQECQAQATSSENSKGRLPDRDVRPRKRYSTLAGGRAVMRSRAAVAATTQILTPGPTKIKLTLAKVQDDHMHQARAFFSARPPHPGRFLSHAFPYGTD